MAYKINARRLNDFTVYICVKRNRGAFVELKYASPIERKLSINYLGKTSITNVNARRHTHTHTQSKNKNQHKFVSLQKFDAQNA